MSKVIVITGAGMGLGRALARRFASEGETIVALGRTGAKVEAVAAELGDPAMAVTCDVTSPDSVRKAFAEIAERHSKIDVLINNAAIYEPFKIADATDEQIQTIINTNLAGPIYCARSAIPMMESGGHILNVSSESVETGFPHLSLYQCSKAGLERFSTALSQELEEANIRVTTVRAGQMFEDGKSVNWDPQAAVAFHEACMKAGINLMERPISQFTSVTDVFVALLNLPQDLQTLSIALAARKPD